MWFGSVVLMALVSCQTSSYKIKERSPAFVADLPSNPPVGTVFFDAWTENEALNNSTLFGLVGVMVTYAVVHDDMNLEGLLLKSETMKRLDRQLGQSSVNYKSYDGMGSYSKQQLSERYNGNAMWGFHSLDDGDLERFFKTGKFKYALHVKTATFEGNGMVIVRTYWDVYDRSYKKVAEYETITVEKSGEELENPETLLKKFHSMQSKNIAEFIKLYQTG